MDDQNPFDWISKFDDYSGDSLDITELVLEAEEEFGLTIPQAVATTFTSADDVVRYLRKRLQEGRG